LRGCFRAPAPGGGRLPQVSPFRCSWASLTAATGDFARISRAFRFAHPGSPSTGRKPRRFRRPKNSL